MVGPGVWVCVVCVCVCVRVRVRVRVRVCVCPLNSTSIAFCEGYYTLCVKFCCLMPKIRYLSCKESLWSCP